MRRLVLICLLCLLPLQWSAAVAACYAGHEGGAPWSEASAESPCQLVLTGDKTPETGNTGPASGTADDDHWCTADGHADDPLWLASALASAARPTSARPCFEYNAPTGSHIPEGPERPDRLRAA